MAHDKTKPLAEADRQAREIFELLARAEQLDYIGESVSQLAHALQCAYWASAAQAPEEEILAALLHDIGHFCQPTPLPEMAGLGVHNHEELGAAYLRAAGLPEAVTNLVAGHVEAKRYLVAKTRGYYEKLSPASKQTLDFQGGPMNQDELRRFERDPLSKAKLRVRQWDEQGKDPAFRAPPLSTYWAMLQRQLGG